MAFESLTERLSGVFKKLRGKGKLNEQDIKAAMREVRMALLEADVNYKVAKDFCNQVSERAMGQEVMESLTPAQQVVKIVNEELTKLMGGDEPQYLRLKNKGQTVIMMCGLQGNGKTTHAAKLGNARRHQAMREDLDRLTQLVMEIRCDNSGQFNPVARITRDTAEMLKIIERLDTQEDANGI